MSSGENVCDDFPPENKISQHNVYHENQHFMDRLNDFMDKKGRMLFTAINLKNCSASQGIYLHGSLDALSNENFTTVPPIEIFMDVPKSSQINHFYKNMERGGVVTGVITSLVDSGFYVTLIAVDVGQARNIFDWKINAFCPAREIPTSGSHEDPLAMFIVKDKVRAVITKVVDDKITISLHEHHLSNCLADIKLGIITDEEVSLYYSRTLDCQGRSYEEVLRNSLEYENPSNTGNLALMFGLCNLDSRPSLMEGLYNTNYDKKEYAEYLRKSQSHRLAMINVKEALRFFKENNTTQAMQMANKALDIDPDNVEALVIRGALYANSEGYAKAVEDFEEALKFEPNHANANKYLIQVLIADAKNKVNEDQTSPARMLLDRAMELNVDRDVSKLIDDLRDDIVRRKHEIEKNKRRHNSRNEERKVEKNFRSDRRISSSSSHHNAVLKYYSPVYVDEDEVFGPELPPKVAKKRKRSTSSSSRSSSRGKSSKKTAKKKKSRRKRKKRESSSSSPSSSSSDHESKKRSHHHSKVKAKMNKKQSPVNASKYSQPNRDSKDVPRKDAIVIKNMIDSSGRHDNDRKVEEVKKVPTLVEPATMPNYEDSLLFVNKERPGETLEEMELFLQKLKGKQKKN